MFFDYQINLGNTADLNSSLQGEHITNVVLPSL